MEIHESKGRASPKKYANHKSLVIDLVQKTGFSRKKVMDRLSLPANFFIDYPEHGAWFDYGMSLYAEAVMECVAENLPNSAQERMKIVERLNIQQDTFTISKPNDAKSAAAAVAEGLVLYSKGQINEKQLEKIISAASAYSELFVNTEMQKQIEELYKLIGDSNGKKA